MSKYANHTHSLHNQIFCTKIVSAYFSAFSHLYAQNHPQSNFTTKEDHYPSCPKSDVNSSSFFKSASFTVGLDVAIDISISDWKTKKREFYSDEEKNKCKRKQISSVKKKEELFVQTL